MPFPLRTLPQSGGFFYLPSPETGGFYFTGISLRQGLVKLSVRKSLPLTASK